MSKAEREYKQVIVIRSDLRMSKGKLAAQAAHAAVEAVLKVLFSGNAIWREWLDEWVKQGQKKVVVKVEGENELVKVFNEAEKMGLPASLIIDAGKTELPPGTKTAVAIGPAPSEAVDKITGKLKLL